MKIRLKNLYDSEPRRIKSNPSKVLSEPQIGSKRLIEVALPGGNVRDASRAVPERRLLAPLSASPRAPLRGRPRKTLKDSHSERSSLIASTRKASLGRRLARSGKHSRGDRRGLVVGRGLRRDGSVAGRRGPDLEVAQSSTYAAARETRIPR